MFTDQAVGLDLDYPVARARFLRMAHGDWLDGLSQDAYTDGLVGEVGSARSAACLACPSWSG